MDATPGRDDKGEKGPPPRTDLLLALQELDLAIDRLRARRNELEGGEELRAARRRAVEAEDRLGELQLSLDALDREQRRLEAEIDSLQRKIDAERGRLYDGSVANPKELQSIEAEVANLEGRRSEREDQLLERMERREELEGRLEPLRAELAEARARVEEVERSAARELSEVERELEARVAEREALAPRLDRKLLELYEELRRQKRGVGAARLEDGVCQGCRQKLSAMYLDRLRRSSGIRRCEYCRRILVFE